MSTVEVSPYVPRGPVAHEINALRLAVITAIVTVLLITMFIGVFMVRAYRRVDSAATTAGKIRDLQQQLISGQQTAADNSQTGREILKAIEQQTSPTATAHQQAVVAGYLASLTDAQKTLNADLLRKVGELAQCVPCSPAAVNRILNEPVPVITFGPAPPRPSSTPPAATPRGTATPSPSPSHTLAPAVQIQCPIICPR
jgi:hypothetical protein